MPNARFVGKQRTRQSLFQKVSILTPYLPAILLFGGSKLWQETLAFETQEIPIYWGGFMLTSFLNKQHNGQFTFLCRSTRNLQSDQEKSFFKYTDYI